MSLDLANLMVTCLKCRQDHLMSADQFPPGTLERLDWRDGRMVWTKELLEHLRMERPVPACYPKVGEDFDAAMATFPLVPEMDGLFVGMLTPWLALRYDFWTAACTGTHEIESHGYGFGLWWNDLEHAYRTKYNLIVSYSTTEHIGLGRYGDALDEDGDLKWMAQMRDRLTPGGRMLLAVPVAKDTNIDACYHRIYGPDRLARLLDGWEIEGIWREGQRFETVPLDVPQGWADWQNQPLLKLRRKD